jgi:hypothetical protein
LQSAVVHLFTILLRTTPFNAVFGSRSDLGFIAHPSMPSSASRVPTAVAIDRYRFMITPRGVEEDRAATCAPARSATLGGASRQRCHDESLLIYGARSGPTADVRPSANSRGFHTNRVFHF